ncbi:MAG TPA: ABC transporter substrate-binding protein [Bradyrhizobium sp.]|nr:ABC transporter substrate-binding protein [Bradyrhizobium sp.]
MIRREFITLLGGAAAIWPLAARAQQPAMPLVGFVHNQDLGGRMHLVEAFRRGLREAGFVEGRNVAVEYHSAESQPDRLRALVADLVRRPAAVIVGNTLAMLAAKAATATVPIVFAGGSDPIELGLVASLDRPGGNVTGAQFFSGVLGAKRLELLRQLVPKATSIGLLVESNNPEAKAEQIDVQAAAQAMGTQLIVADLTNVRDIEPAFATLVQRRAGALLAGSGPFLSANRERLIALAAHHRLPASYSLREFVTAGGLMSYGTSISDAYRQAGIYAGQILKGDKPADLPVVRSTKFEFVLNLKTAQALGLVIPPTLLAIADEVIE